MDDAAGPSGDNRITVGGDAVHRHVMRMRAATVVFLLTLPLLGVIAFHLPSERSPLVPPLLFTLGALAAALWLAFTANRDATARLARAREIFPAHHDERRLLRDHLVVYLLVLLRLEVVASCGLIAAVWGTGPAATLWFLALAAVLMGLTWPTLAKTELLLRRVRDRSG